MTSSNDSPSPGRLTALKECRYGKMLYLRQDKYVGRSLDVYGEFSFGESEVFSQVVKPNDVVVEVGANLGAHTVHLAKLVGPNGWVVAFEPQLVIFQLLCANLALNELFNVHPHNAAVGSAPGTVKIPPLDYTVENNFGGLSLLTGNIGHDVPLVTLDSLSLPSLRLLKVDVEGMEAEVLAGARQTIGRHRPILYVENDREDQSERIVTMIDELGYDMWWHMPAMFNPDNFAHNETNIFENVVSVNLLCVPKERPMSITGLRKVTGPADRWHHRAKP
jgi:FkbM family methyltransferase